MHLLRAVAALALALGAAAADPAAGQPATAPKPRPLPINNPDRTGDFDKLLASRYIRVLVSYSRSLYFNDKGREGGLTADTARDFERYVNQKYRKQLANRPLTVYLVPTTRDVLLAEVVAGRGDIAAGNLTETEERKKLVDFVAPADQKGVRELVVTGPKSPQIATAEDLSGKTVHVRPASSYRESVEALAERLKQAGKPTPKIVVVPDALEDEDMMEMLNAGVLDAIVVDDWVARMWAQVLPNVKVNEQAVLRSGGRIGWAIRKNSPLLTVELNDFYVQFLKKQSVIEVRRAQYHKRVKQMTDPTGVVEARRFEETLRLFQKYGQQYGFDPLMLAAQGYQESRLDQAVRSRVGAIGIMQLMPATGAEMQVGDVRVAEPNIHAGARYMDRLMTRYFADASFADVDRSLFAFAAYNAGPARVAGVRKEAGQRGLDPNRWFNHVEIVAAEKIGLETPTYVRNIYKYYVSYRLMVEVDQARQKARGAVGAPR